MLLFYWILNFLKNNALLNLKIMILTLTVLGVLYAKSEYQIYKKQSLLGPIYKWKSIIYQKGAELT